MARTRGPVATRRSISCASASCSAGSCEPGVDHDELADAEHVRVGVGGGRQGQRLERRDADAVAEEPEARGAVEAAGLGEAFFETGVVFSRQLGERHLDRRRRQPGAAANAIERGGRRDPFAAVELRADGRVGSSAARRLDQEVEAVVADGRHRRCHETADEAVRRGLVGQGHTQLLGDLARAGGGRGRVAGLDRTAGKTPETAEESPAQRAARQVDVAPGRGWSPENAGDGRCGQRCAWRHRGSRAPHLVIDCLDGASRGCARSVPPRALGHFGRLAKST